MMPPATVETLPESTRAAFAEHAALLKHDLGKYVAMQTRWTPVDAPLAERRSALRADLAETRRGPDGVADAVTVWRALRPPLVGEAPLGGANVDLGGDPDVRAIEDAMATVAAVLPLLEGADEATVARAAAAAVAVAEACQRLVRRAKGQ